MVAGQSWPPLAQGQGACLLRIVCEWMQLRMACAKWRKLICRGHPWHRAEWRGLKKKQKSSRLSTPRFLLENGSCRVSWLANRLSPCHAAFDRGNHDGQVTLRRHKFQNESCVPAANHALRFAQGVPPRSLSPRHSAPG